MKTYSADISDTFCYSSLLTPLLTITGCLPTPLLTTFLLPSYPLLTPLPTYPTPFGGVGTRKPHPQSRLGLNAKITSRYENTNSDE